GINIRSKFRGVRTPLLIINYSLLIICLLFASTTYAQNDAARYEIDAKRIGVSPTDKDALPRSREFLRLDSTYYVGWMYEGLYKWDRSADYQGYKNAIPALRKSFLLLKKDYGRLFSNFFAIENLSNRDNFTRYGDLQLVTRALRECYDNLEMPDSTM
ncbi:hypothetical protein, partial [Pseudomonas sp. 4B]|uniref:hypothetical protein n=1 Tax=Pseudomonas sp. 4B TaxID=528574 RepID=UPI0023AEFA13